MKILICTAKSWNIQLAKEFQKSSKDQITVWTEKEELTKESVDGLRPDWIFFPHWSYIIPSSIYENYRCVVFHMTDLPFGRGGSPLQNLIVRGITETKISALRVTKTLDAGDIYLKEPLQLYGSATEIYVRAAKIIFKKMIPEIIAQNMQPVPQEGEVVEFKRRKPEESEITQDLTISQIYDRIRMLDAEGYPNAFIKFGKCRLYFTHAQQDFNSIDCNVKIEEVENE